MNQGYVEDPGYAGLDVPIGLGETVPPRRSPLRKVIPPEVEFFQHLPWC